MASSFSKRWSALLSIREKVIGESTPNPAQAIDKTSVNAAPASSEDATNATPPIETPVEVPAAPANSPDKGKGKRLSPLVLGEKGVWRKLKSRFRGNGRLRVLVFLLSTSLTRC